MKAHRIVSRLLILFCLLAPALHGCASRSRPAENAASQDESGDNGNTGNKKSQKKEKKKPRTPPPPISY